MPVKCVRRGDKYRVVESATGAIAKNQGGTALDGGGHQTKGACDKQAAAVNASQRKRQTNK